MLHECPLADHVWKEIGNCCGHMLDMGSTIKESLEALSNLNLSRDHMNAIYVIYLAIIWLL